MERVKLTLWLLHFSVLKPTSIGKKFCFLKKWSKKFAIYHGTSINNVFLRGLAVKVIILGTGYGLLANSFTTQWTVISSTLKREPFSQTPDSVTCLNLTHHIFLQILRPTLFLQVLDMEITNFYLKSRRKPHEWMGII